ncbi:ABC transporter permease [Patulibacter brassicae]|jgi:ABC-2 type transport system permease protein|uniref:ABC transporter permease n=1 Tax=Patulibacter brassicae TaxID=1705717 RepID=A0ABU4VR51_9ACTN|nr:ABC transporter permease [Patulibacter brassicae]MDX8153421.1 ABC transporter permease [Patulibacter brassicae]
MSVTAPTGSAPVEPAGHVPGAFAPRPGRAGTLAMLLAQTRMELTLILRNGEQVLLNLIVPLGLLVVCTKIPFIEVSGERADFFVPGVLALAVMSAAFTGQAIATGFDRQYGVLKRLGATALPRTILLGAKTCAVLVIELLQVAVLCLAGIALGWEPHGNPLSVAVLIGVGTAAFCGMAFLMAGLLRAMTTLALANIVWFLLLVFGGIAFPLHELGGAADLMELLPTGALSNGLRMVLETGEVAPVTDVLVLGAWAVVTLTGAALTFRWE